MELKGKTVLVVGGSGVLGGEVVKILSDRGARVLATCSSNESSAKIPTVASLALLVDLRFPGSIRALTDYLNSNFQLDGIVIASGRVGFGSIENTRLEDSEALMQINHSGPVRLITDLIQNLANQPESFVAAITGVVVEKTFPNMSAYSASKSSFSSWLSTLALEAKRLGIKVLDARPGHTETGLANRPLFGSAPTMPNGMNPIHVASKICEAIEAEVNLLDSSSF
jgi:cyclic-di-GMP-binding biofilm dispersal mediator protein